MKDGLQLAKLRTNDPKKYVSTATALLKDHLKSKDSTGRRKHTVRFEHTLETLLKATNDDPAWIATLLGTESSTTTEVSRPNTSDPPKKVAEEHNAAVENDVHPTEISTVAQVHRSDTMIDEGDDQRAIITTPETSLSGLTVAQLAALLAGQAPSNQQKIQLTNGQLEQ